MRKTTLATFMACLISLLISNSTIAGEYRIEKKTAIALQERLNGGEIKSDEGAIKVLSHILAQDKAVQNFTQMIVDLCQNPSKYDFPSEGIDVSECTFEKASVRVQDDLAYTLIENFKGNVRGDQVEGYLNNFLNTYLEKMKAVIEAFNSWM